MGTKGVRRRTRATIGSSTAPSLPAAAAPRSQVIGCKRQTVVAAARLSRLSSTTAATSIGLRVCGDETAALPPGSTRPATVRVMPLIAAEPQLRSVNVALAGGTAVAVASAATSYVTGFGCPLYDVSGHLCAFCGATRAVVALVNGNPVHALHSNGLVVMILAFAAVRFLLQAVGGRTIVDSGDALIVRIDVRVWAVGLLAWTVTRNLPWLGFLRPVA